MDGEIIGAGLADRGRHDLDQPEDEGDFGDLVQHAAAGAPDILHDAKLRFDEVGGSAGFDRERALRDLGPA